MMAKRKFKYIIGIDEVGRGPLAGPVTVAAVVSDRITPKIFKGIKDSKKLSEKKREEWFKKLKTQNAKLETLAQNSRIIHITTSSVNNKIIDKIGIVKAINLAIKRIVLDLKRKIGIRPENCYFLLDGSLKVPQEYSQRTIIKGDEKIPLISAASIVAKVTRDRFMKDLHKKMPCYLFHLHKGYGTKLHYERIGKCGLSDYHRKSYCRFIKPFKPSRRKKLKGLK